EKRVHRSAHPLAGLNIRELLAGHVHRHERVEIDVRIHGDGSCVLFVDRALGPRGWRKGGTNKQAQKQGCCSFDHDTLLSKASRHSRRSNTAYAYNGASALRSVALEIPISPLKGLSSSKTRKIAPANDSAHTNRAVIMMRLVRANKVKLTKMALSQKTRMI